MPGKAPIGVSECFQWFHYCFRYVLSAILSKLASRVCRAQLCQTLQALTSSRTFDSTSGDFMIDVPARNADAPAFFNRTISLRFSMPLSDTTGRSILPFIARTRSVVDRSSSNVERFRLLIPYKSGLCSGSFLNSSRSEEHTSELQSLTN